MYTPDNVVFKWEEDNAVTYNSEMEMAQFKIGHIEHKDCTGDFEGKTFFRLLFFFFQYLIIQTLWASFCVSLYISIGVSLQISLWVSI